jgi:ABC-2 type transport system ATP-binding protein
MHKLGRKLLTLHLQSPLALIPPALAEWPLVLKAGGSELEYTFDVDEQSQRVPALLRHLEELGIAYLDLNTRQSSLEEIFISLVSERPRVAA